MPRATDGTAAPGARAWWRQPVAWLGVAIFVASLAGCVVMILLAEQSADRELPTAGGEVLKVPLARPAAIGRAAPNEP